MKILCVHGLAVVLLCPAVVACSSGTASDPGAGGVGGGGIPGGSDASAGGGGGRSGGSGADAGSWGVGGIIGGSDADADADLAMLDVRRETDLADVSQARGAEVLSALDAATRRPGDVGDAASADSGFADVALDLSPGPGARQDAADIEEVAPGPADAGPGDVTACVPDCSELACGPDPLCGDSCGTCGDGLGCTDDACVAGYCEVIVQQFHCVVEGTCVPSGTVNPANPCELCQPLSTAWAWSSAADGLQCGGGHFCYEGGCCAPDCGGQPGCADDGCGGICLPCFPSECGDGQLNQEWEECDDGNHAGGDGCSAECVCDAASMLFAGGHVLIGQDPDFDLESPFTVELWARWAPGVDPLKQRDLISNVNSGGFRIWQNMQGRLRGSYRGPGGNPAYTVTTATPFAPSTWSHIAMTHDGQSLVLYVDGQLVDAVDAPSEKLFGSAPLTIGDLPDIGVAGYHFEGALAEVRISAINRYPTEFFPEPRLEADLMTVALWHLDQVDDDGTTPDDSGNAHHGQVVGADLVADYPLCGNKTADCGGVPDCQGDCAAYWPCGAACPDGVQLTCGAVLTNQNPLDGEQTWSEFGCSPTEGDTYAYSNPHLIYYAEPDPGCDFAVHLTPTPTDLGFTIHHIYALGPGCNNETCLDAAQAMASPASVSVKASESAWAWIAVTGDDQTMSVGDHTYGIQMTCDCP